MRTLAVLVLLVLVAVIDAHHKKCPSRDVRTTTAPRGNCGNKGKCPTARSRKTTKLPKPTPKPSKRTPKPSKKTPKPSKKTPKPSKRTPKPSKRTPKPSKRTPKPSKRTPKPSNKTPPPVTPQQPLPTDKPVPTPDADPTTKEPEVTTMSTAGPTAAATQTPKRCCPSPTANTGTQTVQEAPTIIEPLWANDPCSDHYYIYCSWADSPLYTNATVLAIFANDRKFIVWSAEAQPKARSFPFVMKMRVECDRNMLTWNLLSFRNVTTVTCNIHTTRAPMMETAPNIEANTFVWPPPPGIDTGPFNLLPVVQTPFFCPFPTMFDM